MPIELTPDQWASVTAGGERPPRVSGPAADASFVLVPSDVHDRYKSLFEDPPVTEAERLFQLREFGRRAGWDDPEMDIYDDLDPRRQK